MLSLSSILLLTASAALAVPSHDIHNLKRHQDLVKRKTYSTDQVTWYPTDTGADACTGKDHKDSDPYVALNVADWNNGENCGRKILITANGVTKPGTIVDKCASCGRSGQIDLTRDLFTSFGYPLSKGVFKASWVYADEQQGEPEPPKTPKPTPTPTPTKTPTPTPTTTKKPDTPTTTKKPDTPTTTKKPDTPSPSPSPAPEEGEDEEDEEDCEYGYEDDEEEEEAPAPQPETPKPAAPKPEAPKPAAPKPEAPKPAAPKPEAPKPAAPKPEAPKPETPKTTPTATPTSTPPAVVVATPPAAGLAPSDPAPAVVNPAAAPSESVGTDSIQGGIAGDNTFGNGAVSVGYSKAVPAIVTLVFLVLQVL